MPTTNGETLCTLTVNPLHPNKKCPTMTRCHDDVMNDDVITMTLFHFTRPPVPITARMHSTPQDALNTPGRTQHPRMHSTPQDALNTPGRRDDIMM
eukprot:1843085-Pyramimonas_sp.AAC.2